jgi:tetratricopeptide (TPR) repeat protein
MTMQILSNPLSILSSVLIEPPIPTALPTDAELISGYLLYAAGRCDAPHPLLQSDPYLKVSCALLADDTDTALPILRVYSDHLNPSVRLWAWVNLSWLDLRDGNSATAFERMDMLVQDYTQGAYQAEALAKRAALHALAFDFDAAIADMDAAIALVPDEPRYYKQRGDHIFLIYEWDRVLDDYNTAITLDPTYADAYYARGILYYTQGPRADAIPDFEQFLALAPHDRKATNAATYITSIEAEIEALGGDDTEPAFNTQD